MRIRIRFTLLLLIAVLLPGTSGLAEPSHGISMHGSPSLPADYPHFPYVNPDAPKGGKITYGVIGSFDSVNPFILKSMRSTARGSWDHQFGRLVFESLLFRNRDEPFSMYGLLAEKVEWPDDRSWIEFTLNPKAKWSDGVPVTVEDVLFTYELLTEKGRPPYSSRMNKIESIEKSGPRKVKFTFNDKADLEYPMIISLSPILPKHAIDKSTFDQTSLKPMVGSGPYIMDEIVAGKYITYKRNPDYWANDLPSRIGFANYDEVKVEYFRNENSRFESFKKGLIDVYLTNDPVSWLRKFDFPAVEDERVIKDEFPTNLVHMQGLVFNARRPIFADRNVRAALSDAFDFEWMNRAIYFGAYKRTASFWQGSELSSFGRPASEAEKRLLKPFKDRVLPEVLEGTYQPPVSNGSGRDRKIMRQVLSKLTNAGFKREGTSVLTPDGTPFSFEILVKNASEEQLALAYQRMVKRLGIEADIRFVDDAQYQRRVQEYDYDMIVRTYSTSLSPGIEQIWRWGTRAADIPGTFNFAGAKDPALDKMIDHLLQAKSREDFVTAVRAYDRLLISGHYLIPLFHLDKQWVARWSHIERPQKTSIYGYQFETWWDARVKEKKATTQ